MEITVKRFPTSYYHISGEGVCDWSQPPRWPCDEATLRDYACSEASETFIVYAMERSAEDRQCQAEEAASMDAQLAEYHRDYAKLTTKPIA